MTGTMSFSLEEEDPDVKPYLRRLQTYDPFDNRDPFENRELEFAEEESPEDLLPPPPLPLSRLTTFDPFESPGSWLVPGGPVTQITPSPEDMDISRCQFSVTQKDLRSTSKVLVSRSQSGAGTTWKIILTPCAVSTSKGGASFRAAHGRVKIQLKCEGTPLEPRMKFRFVVNGVERGPEEHDFSATAVASLTQPEWDLSEIAESGLTIEAEMWPYPDLRC
jgi:hypothetical protein